MQPQVAPGAIERSTPSGLYILMVFMINFLYFTQSGNAIAQKFFSK
jgi:hypothetical protein